MRKRGWFGGVVAAIAVVVLVVFFLPARLGGDMYYVMLTGPSMEPHFHLGDLVLVRRAAFYQPGDVVLYRHPRIGFVFHRIVGFDEQGRFRLKGDNNDWEDPYHPAADEVLGRFVVRVPYVGKALQKVRSPGMIAALVVLIAVLLLLDRFPDDEEEDGGMMGQSDSLRDWMWVFAAVLLLAAVLGVVAFTRPPYVQVQEPVPYQHEAVFSYTARAPAGLYDLPQVQPGEPIFTQLTGTLTVSCNYRFTAEAPYQIHGTYQLFARVSDSTGWKRTLPLTQQATFENGTFSAEAVVHLEDLQRFITELEQATSIRRSAYVLSVFAHIETEGSVGGMTFQETYEPALRFQWNGEALVVATSSAAPGEDSSDPFHQVRSDALVLVKQQPNTVMILGAQLPVPLARQIALGAGVVSLLLLAWTWRKAEKQAAVDPVAHLRFVEGVTVVPLQDVPDSLGPQIALETLKDLADLAVAYRRPVLYLRNGEQVHFWVRTPEALYQYTSETAPLALPARERSLSWWRNGAETSYPSPWCDDVLSGWAQAVDAHSVGDPRHSQRVADLATAIGKAMKLSPDALQNLRRAALLHALGLMDVPAEIVHKQTPLTDEERQTLQEHIRRLNARFATAEALRDALRIAYYRSERWDGSGYPEGLSGTEIPLEARILAVADVWDALRHDRPHRKAWPLEATKRFMRQKAGQWFDPDVVDALLQVVEADKTAAEGAHAPADEEVDDETAVDAQA